VVHQLESKVFNSTESQGLINAWILGDELIMPGFQNECLHRISDVEKTLRKSIGLDMHEMWEKTGEGSKLRMYFVDRMVTMKLPAGLSSDVLGDLPSRMLQDMYVRVRTFLPTTVAADSRPEKNLQIFEVTVKDECEDMRRMFDSVRIT
jgi:hypothetical protein